VSAPWIVGILLLLAAGLGPASAQVEPSPAAGDTEPATASGESVVVVRATTDEAEVADLIAGFRKAHPGVAVSYTKMNSATLYDSFVEEAAAGAGTADIVWSSAMDRQIKLVNDGYAARYASPEAAARRPGPCGATRPSA
jgi:iron(III) transport system substrate-binding protein